MQAAIFRNTQVADIKAVFHLQVRTDQEYLDFDLPDQAKVAVCLPEIDLWRSHAGMLQRLNAYSIQLHDYRCEFFDINTDYLDESEEDGFEQHVPSDFRQEASTLFITTGGVQWRGYQKHASGIQWVTEQLSFNEIDARLAEAAAQAGQPCMPALCRLWNALADVPVTEEEGEEGGPLLDEQFAHWPVGTEVYAIWRWFEAQHPAFIVGEAGQHIGDNHPFRLIAS